ncbi:MAG: hypothetical protein U0075_06095 [Thermomicrobiales bacterium]
MEDPQRPRDSFSLGAWLLAELMLGLAMLFFAANTLGFVAGSSSATPTSPPDWQATIEAQQTMQANVEATATAGALNDDSIPVLAVQATLTILATSQAEVQATADAYATQAAFPTPTPVPSPTLPPPTSTPLPTPKPQATSTPPPDTQATRIRELERELTQVAGTPTATIAPTPTPAETCIETINKQEFLVEIPADLWVPASEEQRNALLRDYFRPYSGQRIGLSLTFGHSQTRGEGLSISREANALMKKALPEMVGNGTILKNYTDPDISNGVGGVTFEVYFYTGACT